MSYSSSDNEYADATSNFDQDSPISLSQSLEHRASVQADLNSSVLNEEPNFNDEHEDFDKIYEENYETDLGNVQNQHGNVITHLLSQVLYFSDITN